MAPYRTRDEPRAAKVAPRTGLVADMVRQFADVHAFVRELVQNGIDAGATGITVVVDRSSDGIASVRVTDDGCGMTLEVIEDALLVLFRSTKDEDTTKIGKYGVGFMSVFAIEPSEVTVDTWRDGYAHRVRLFPDHSYEIEKAAPREASGTAVTLTKTMPAEDYPAFWEKVGASLYRWCRHAELPIELVVTDASSTAPPQRTRVDTPLDVRAIVSVRRTFEDMEIVAGPLAGSFEMPETGTPEDEPAPFAGFYNRGLMLHETNQALSSELATMRFKVKSARLSHTLSRDDVRRDQGFHLAVERARSLVTTDLRIAVLRALALEAEAAARDAPAPRLAALLDAATLEPVEANAEQIVVPLAHPIGGTLAMTPAEIGQRAGRLGLRGGLVPATSQRTALTAALAKTGVPVAWIARPAVSLAIGRASGGDLVAAPVASECLLVTELPHAEKQPADDALCAQLGEALKTWGIGRVALGQLSGDEQRIGAMIADPTAGAREHLVLTQDANVAARRWPSGALLVLDVRAEPVACARRATSPAIAAHLLARYLLLRGPGLTSARSEDLATQALSEIR